MRRLAAKASIAVVMLALAASAVALRQGVVPARLSPLPALDLAQPAGLLVDWQLAGLRYDADACKAALGRPSIEASPISNMPYREGCGVTNGVRIARVAGARLALDRVTCETAAAVALWMHHDVQPLAASLFGQPVASVQHMGSYACRNVRGSPLAKDQRSEHAGGNAIDLAGLTLADGRVISVGRHWKTQGKEGELLRAMHQRACRYFRTVLGSRLQRRPPRPHPPRPRRPGGVPIGVTWPPERL